MAKSGIDTDYDLHANLTPAAQQVHTCDTCGMTPVVYQWSDCNGEGMCVQCGTPYQLINGSDARMAEKAYPYRNLTEKWQAIAKEYWNDTHRFVAHGMVFMSEPRGMAELVEWCRIKHPELLNQES